MKRPIARALAAVLGAIAATIAIGALAIAASAGSVRPGGASWVILPVVGGAVGILSWLLLSSAPSSRETDRKPAVAPCAECGSEVFEEWRICPYCGGSRDTSTREAEQSTRTA